MFRTDLLHAYLFILVCALLATHARADGSSDVPGPSEFKPVTMAELVTSPDLYNKERVRLEGRVFEVEYTESGKGEPFTLFKLRDGDKNEVRVYFEDEHLPLSPGDRVEIMGRYRKKKSYFLYSIKNVIKARYVRKLPEE